MTLRQAFDLAVGHHRAGRLVEAEGVYRQILGQVPGNADALRLLGMVLFQTERFEEAAGVLERAVGAGQQTAEVYYYLGTALWKCRRGNEAMGALRKSLAIRGDSFAANNSLGLALVTLGQVDEGIAVLRRAVELNPVASEPWVNLGNALRSAGRVEEALSCFRQAVAINDDPAGWDNVLFTLNYVPGVDTGMIRAEHETWYRRVVEARVKALGRVTTWSNVRDADKRLKVGFVSGDFNRHPVARFLLPLIENLNRAAVEVFCYSNTAELDAQTDRFRSAADGWRDIRAAGNMQAAEMVRSDGVDILVDLSLHGEGNRLGVFALKPAPVQATWLGYAGTTGLPEVDYRITDGVMDPEEAGDVFVEKAARLSGCFWCYRPPDFAPDVSELPAAKNGYVTFGCLNNFAKVNEGVIQVWAKVMGVVGSSRIMIHAPEGSSRENVMRTFGDAGVEGSRVKFAGFLPTDRYLAEYSGIDVALDPFPFGGGTTTFDTLWMGVPVVTLTGKMPAGRGGASILRHLGRGEWVAAGEEQYVTIAKGLAADVEGLALARAELREQLRRSGLVDEKGFAGEMGKTLRWMWGEFCRSIGS